MKPVDDLEKQADEQATQSRETQAHARSVLSKFKLSTMQKKILLDQYAAQDAAVAKKKKAARGV